MQVDVVRRITSGLAILALATLIFTYSRLVRTVETAATAAGFVDSDVAGRS